MTPEEAGQFRESDEDPAEIFARFDAGPHDVTEARPIEIRRRDPAEVRARLLAPDSPLPRDLAEALAAGLPASHADGEPDMRHQSAGEPAPGEPSGAPSGVPEAAPDSAPQGVPPGAPASEPPSGAPAGAPPRRVRRGTRTFIREHFECRPGGCGAKPGEPCVAYQATRWSDPPSGRPSTNVHAPRWRAYHAWLADQSRRQDPG